MGSAHVNVNETGIVFQPEETTLELTEEQKKLRDRFVEQYMIDFEPVGAAIRVGYAKLYAKEYAQKFMDEPYVRQAIARKMVAASEDEKTEDNEDKRRVRKLLIREATNYGPGSSHAARVAALGKLASVFGMEAPTKSHHEHNHRGGVMAVPGIAGPQEWEDAAVASQKKLATDVRH